MRHLPGLLRGYRVDRRWALLSGGYDPAVGPEDHDNEVAGAIGGWDNSIQEILYQGNADELYQDQEADEPWVDDGGIRNWDMDYVWDPEEEEEVLNYYYLGGLRCDLRIDLYSEETLEEYHEDDEELYPTSTCLLPQRSRAVHQLTVQKRLYTAWLSSQLAAG